MSGNDLHKLFGCGPELLRNNNSRIRVQSRLILETPERKHHSMDHKLTSARAVIKHELYLYKKSDALRSLR